MGKHQREKAEKRAKEAETSILQNMSSLEALEKKLKILKDQAEKESDPLANEDMRKAIEKEEVAHAAWKKKAEETAKEDAAAVQKLYKEANDVLTEHEQWEDVGEWENEKENKANGEHYEHGNLSEPAVEFTENDFVQQSKRSHSN